jgi:hypothetical protein
MYLFAYEGGDVMIIARKGNRVITLYQQLLS